MIELTDVNWIAIVVSTLVAYVIGGVWYSPKLFGQVWMDEHGHTEESLGNPAKAMGLTLITSTVSSWVLAVLISNMNIARIQDGAVLGILIGIGILFATRFSDGLYNNQSTKLALIEGGYRAVYTLVVCIILSAWQ